MVLRCPRCSALRFFGRTQVLGELVVCPQCETAFRWGDAHTGESDAQPAPRSTRGTRIGPEESHGNDDTQED